MMYVVEVYVNGWLFTSQPLSRASAQICASDFKRLNPLSRPTIAPAPEAA